MTPKPEEQRPSADPALGCAAERVAHRPCVTRRGRCSRRTVRKSEGAVKLRVSQQIASNGRAVHSLLLGEGQSVMFETEFEFFVGKPGAAGESTPG
jgi:hypothetical protein